MDATGDDHTKWSKSERERQIPHDIMSFVESKVWHKWTYPQNRKRLTDREQTCGCHGGRVGREKE